MFEELFIVDPIHWIEIQWNGSNGLLFIFLNCKHRVKCIHYNILRFFSCFELPFGNLVRYLQREFSVASIEYQRSFTLNSKEGLP